MNGITTEFVTLDADLANELLGHNVQNRPVKPRTVETYKQAMIRGDWLLTAEPIKIDANGNLIDGQHRCLALVAATSVAERPVTIEVLLVRGLAPESQDVMDSGARRSVADQLARRGAHSYAQVSAAIRCIIAYRTGNERPPREEMIGFYDEWSEILTQGTKIVPLHGNTSALSPSAILAAWFLITAACADEEAVTGFFHVLQKGTDLEEGSPILALRNRAYLAKQRREIIINSTATAMIVRAWNAWRTGTPMAKIAARSRAGGDVTIRKIES